MSPKKTVLRTLMLGIVIACLSFLIFTNPDTGGSRILSAVMNCGHFPLFGVIALALFYFYEFGQARYVKNYYRAWSVAAGLGLLTEFMQLFDPGRYFELRDLVYDALGALTFLAFSFSFRLSSERMGRVVRIGTALLCLAATTPIWLAVTEREHMRKDFPLISTFETPQDISRWEAHDAIITQAQEHATHGAFSAEVTLSPGEYPGLSSDYFVSDWNGYNTLACDIFLVGDAVLPLTIRINDKTHTQAYADRYNHTFTLQPGPNRIRIPLKNIALAPRGRGMDMQAISLICIFAYRLNTPRTVFIDNIRLS